MYVVLRITVLVSLFSVRFLEGCTAVSLCMCVVSLVCSYLVVSPCCVYYNSYHCVSVSQRRMLLISHFLIMVVY